MKKRRCLHCREYSLMEDMINPRNGWFCGFDHMAAHGLAKSKKIKAKADKASHTAAKRKLKDEDRSFQLKKTQTLFNKFIRLRDRHLGCISCGKPFNDKYDAGHYRSVGANPELRFQELNNFGQCVHCNQHLSANLINYRIGLVQRIGQDKVDWLEGPHKAKRYSIYDLKVLQRWYTRKTKRLEL